MVVKNSKISFFNSQAIQLFMQFYSNGVIASTVIMEERDDTLHIVKLLFDAKIFFIFG